MKLEPICDDESDRDLFERMFCDPIHMKDLGGAQPLEKVRLMHLIAVSLVHLTLLLLGMSFISSPPSFQVGSILAKQVSCMEQGKGWIYRIVPEEEDLKALVDCNPEERATFSKGVGTVCVWEGYWEEHSVPIVEMGWGVVPRYQGRGFGTQAVRLLLQMVEHDTERRWGSAIHAFTSLNNAPSNSLCRKCSFRLVGESTVDYEGCPLISNHYEYDVKYL